MSEEKSPIRVFIEQISESQGVEYRPSYVQDLVLERE